MAKKDIIVIGGSAGSSGVLRRLFTDLPADLPASLFVSTHMPAHSSGYLADALDRVAAFPVAEAVDGQPVERGRAYVAAPDRHLMVLNGVVRLADGPRENMARPAVDPLFRSAALTYGPRAVGVILSGMLNDGASGLAAIKACGGTAVVQHPLDAEADQMPTFAMEAVIPDHVAAADGLAPLLTEIAATDAGAGEPATDDLILEVEIAMGARLGAHRLASVSQPSALSCPDCHGVLSEMNEARPLRYRCQIGHAYTAEALASHTEEIDAAVRIAMRMMEERVTLVTRMAEDARRSGRSAVAELYESRAEEYSRYAATLREAAVLSLRMGRSRREQEI
ncbi:MAG: chemotaxis protein CheB [Alphaproteobacteria bacterium]|nr:chemotaxis protein CheB [Alphaproteobacteria bacterium]